MIKVPGSNGSLQNARSQGADVTIYLFSMECIKLQKMKIQIKQ